MKKKRVFSRHPTSQLSQCIPSRLEAVAWAKICCLGWYTDRSTESPLWRVRIHRKMTGKFLHSECVDFCLDVYFEGIRISYKITMAGTIVLLMLFLICRILYRILLSSVCLCLIGRIQKSTAPPRLCKNQNDRNTCNFWHSNGCALVKKVAEESRQRWTSWRLFKGACQILTKVPHP